ncbi:MAG: hypothetical protein ABW292_01575 [Vicinamibacterales bacterium]
MLRGLVGVALGLLTAAVFFQASTALLLLATDGNPLGAESRSSTFGELVGYLAVGIAAAVIGGWVTARITGPHMAWPLFLLGIVLGATAYVAFTAPTSQWPLWWAVILTALVPPGVWVGGRGVGSAVRNRSR